MLPRRNAPPPASEEAIASLKSRKTAIKDIGTWFWMDQMRYVEIVVH